MSIPRRAGWLVPLVSLALVVPVVGAFGSAVGAETRQLVFADEFSGTTVDGSRWSTCYFWRGSNCTNEWNNELEVYTPANVSVADGELRMTARRETATGYLQDGTPRTFSYTSGMVSSDARFSFQYGYVEFRAKVVSGRGLWPALWLMAADHAWPPEIDVMEYIGSQPDRVYMTNHAADGSANTSFAYVGPDFSQGWHTYAIDWRPGSLTFLVDGVARGTVTNGVPSEPMYLLANLAVGGNWPGSPDASTVFPATFAVDYVRVWQDLPGTTTTTGPSTTSTPVTAGTSTTSATSTTATTTPTTTRPGRANARPPRGRFKDTSTSVHDAGITALAEAGVASGYPDDTFRPEAEVTRGQLATFLGRALDLDGRPAPFIDAAGTAHADGIGALVSAGIVSGFPDGTFRPSDPVSRGQAAAMLARALGVNRAAGGVAFADTGASPYAAEIAALAEHEVVVGYLDGTFRPLATLSRGAMATILARAFLS